jgi:hypothetical protein
MQIQVYFRDKIKIAIASSLIILLTGCGGNEKASIKVAPAPAPVVEDAVPPLNNWVKLTDRVTDFGDRQVIFDNTIRNSANDKFSLLAACTAGLFELWIETNFYVPDKSNAAARIRLNGGTADSWALDKIANAGDGVFAVRFKNSAKLFQEIKNSATLSVQLDSSNNTFSAATFDLQGVGEIPKQLSNAGCN